LKKLLDGQMLDAAALRELLAKNGRAGRPKREGAEPLRTAGLRSRSHDGPLQVTPVAGHRLRTQLRELANERKRFGYRRLFVLAQQGEPSEINCNYRLYREEGHRAQASLTAPRANRAGQTHAERLLREF
jgi:putative transposase